MMKRAKRLKRRLESFLFFYGLLLIFVNSVIAWLIMTPGDQSLYIALMWIAYGIAYVLLWNYYIES